MMQEQVTDKDLDRIKNLLLKAKSTDSEEEAMAFMAKVQELLTKYNISMNKVESHNVKGKKSSRDIEDTLISLDEINDPRHGQWIKTLINVTCNCSWCKAILMTQPKGSTLQGEIMIIGTEYNIEITIHLIKYLRNAILAIEKKSWKEYEQGDGDQKRGTYRRDFLLACTLRVCYRMKEAFKAQQEDDHQKTLQEASNANDIKGLIIYNEKALTNYIEEKVGGTHKTKGPKVKYRDGYFAGDDAGNKISLNKHLNTNSSNSQLN